MPHSKQLVYGMLPLVVFILTFSTFIALSPKLKMTTQKAPLLIGLNINEKEEKT